MSYNETVLFHLMVTTWTFHFVKKKYYYINLVLQNIEQWKQMF